MANTYTYYDILGVGINATGQEINIAFRNRIKNYRFVKYTQEAEERLKATTKAYNVLSDLKKRKAYDDDLKRNHKVNFDEQLHDPKSDPYTSYSKKQTEKNFGDWIGIYLLVVSRPMDMKELNSYIYALKYAICLAEAESVIVEARNFSAHDKPNLHSQSQYASRKRMYIKRKRF